MVSKESNGGTPGSAVDQFNVVLEKRKKTIEQKLFEVRENMEQLRLEKALLEAHLGHIDALLGEGIMKVEAGEVIERSGVERTIVDEVIELIRENGGPIHYREIERRLRDKGVSIPEGKDPATALLVRYYNDERLFRPGRGTYDLRNGRNVKSVGTKRYKTRRKK